MTPKWIVWHTAAHWSPQQNKCFDTTAEEIDRWHRERKPPFREIGYHGVVRWSGDIEPGRGDTVQGAHVVGLNNRSLGLCFSGCGEHEPLTEEQMAAGLKWTRDKMEKFNIDADHVIGHNENIRLIEQGDLAKKYRRVKACPGRYVDMDEVRRTLKGENSNEPKYCECIHCGNTFTKCPCLN
jgi:hypothetical protein